MSCRSEEMSFVVQGPVARTEIVSTQAVCASIRRHFPGAEIVLSTWEGENVDGLGADRFVFSADPGALPQPWNVNLNRQIVSSREGIAQATRPLVIKSRTDILFTQPTVLDFWDRWQDRVPNLRLFQKRILIPNTLTFRPSPLMPHALHPSDFCFFGLKEDLEFLFDVPLCSLSDMLVVTPPDVLAPSREGGRRYSRRSSAEQYLFVSALRKRFPEVELPDVFTLNPELFYATEAAIANNFVVLNATQQFGIHCPKHADAETHFGAHNLYQHSDWLELHNHYCEANPVSPDNATGIQSDQNVTDLLTASDSELSRWSAEEDRLNLLRQRGYRWEAMLIAARARLLARNSPRVRPETQSVDEMMAGWCSAWLHRSQLREREKRKSSETADLASTRAGDAGRIAQFSAQVQAFLPQAQTSTTEFRLRLHTVLEKLNIMACGLLQQMETSDGYAELQRLYEQAAMRCWLDYEAHLDARHRAIMDSLVVTDAFQVRAQLLALQRDEALHGPTLRDLAAILSQQGRVAEATRLQRIADAIPSDTHLKHDRRDIPEDTALAA